ncbi:MAG: electron transport complex subunit RsxB [Magnetococcales bacterium]|nr:electron transport complex subunit RsxB [Magnetococcales bacterium]
MIEAVLSMGGLALAAGLGLGFASKKFHVEGDPMAEKLEAALPATNCGNCGFPGCRPYADALVGGAPINLCLPGGNATMEAIAQILGVDPKPVVSDGPKTAMIRENDCIGCTACIKVCPVDAIIGANKQSHTVITSECTGCVACVEPCPVDCIDMIPVQETLYDWRWQKPAGPIAASGSLALN